MDSLEERLTKKHKQAITLLNDKKVLNKMKRHFKVELAYHAISVEQVDMSKEDVAEYIRELNKK